MGSTLCKGKGRFLFPDFYYRVSYCVAASLLLGFFRTARCLGHAHRLQVAEPGVCLSAVAAAWYTARLPVAIHCCTISAEGQKSIYRCRYKTTLEVSNAALFPNYFEQTCFLHHTCWNNYFWNWVCFSGELECLQYHVRFFIFLIFSTFRTRHSLAKCACTLVTAVCVSVSLSGNLYVLRYNFGEW